MIFLYILAIGNKSKNNNKNTDHKYINWLHILPLRIVVSLAQIYASPHLVDYNNYDKDVCLAIVMNNKKKPKK
jgi:hypothetical protein